MYQVRSPGATILFGNRTIDSDGYALAMATDRVTTIDATPATAVTVTAGGETRTFATDETDLVSDWTDPIRGCYAVLAERGFEPSGFEGTIDGELSERWAKAGDSGIGGPEARVSLELAVLALLGAASDLDLDRADIAGLAERVESEFFGREYRTPLPSTIALSKAGSVRFLDGSTDSWAQMAVPEPLEFLGVETDSSGTNANDVRESVRQALDELGVDASTAVDLATLSQLEGAAAEDLGYVVRENARARQATVALDDDESERFGALLVEAQHDAREHLGAGTDDDRQIIETATENGAYGARTTETGVLIAVEAARMAAVRDAIDDVSTDGQELTRLDPADGVVVSESE